MKINRFHKYLLYSLLGTSVFLTSCNTDDDTGPKGAYEHGVFIVNEGNFGSPTSEISYYNPNTKEVTPEVFNKVNDRPLGDGAQHLTFIGEKGYITLNNSEKIEVVDANTFASLGVITGLKIPRYIAAVNNKAYVTEYVGYSFLGYTGTGRVSVIDLTTNTVTKTINVGLLPEGILAYNGKVYVANSGGSTISVINPTTDVVESTINVGNSPSRMVLDANNKIWVIRGDYMSTGALVKVDPANNHSVTTFDFAQGTTGAGPLAINGTRNTLFFSYGGKVFSMSTTASALPTNAIINRSAYGLGVSPEQGVLYLGTGPYNANGKVVRYQLSGSPIDSFQVRILPNGFVFK